MIKKLLSLFFNKQLTLSQTQIEPNDCKCEHQYDVEIDDYLFQQIFDEKVAIFAGAGISTESKFVYPITFYEEIAYELNLIDKNLSFPELMEKYEEQVDGRTRLIKKIQNRFDHLNSFGFTRWASTMFHRQLATLYPIKTIITTNWDLNFEEYCKTIPYVYEQDMSFWDDTKRNVLKIHGSINSYGSLIATSSDYKRAEKSLNAGGLLGSKLKTILTEKNIIFIGYSFSDSDFQEIYNFVKNTLDKFHKQSYVVTPFEEEAKKFEELGFISIITDGTYFLELIKKRAIQEKLLFDDKIYEKVQELLWLITEIHEDTCITINSKNYPHIIYTLAYQDGMIDALERAINFQTTGEYSNPNLLLEVAMSYENSLDLRFEQKQNEYIDDILDIAYIEGYKHALFYILHEGDEYSSKFPPFYYFYGFSEIESVKEFEQALKKYPRKFKKEYKNAFEYVKTFPEGHEYHHPPILF